jgi:ABC-type transporter Mla subunit MlaD
MADSATRDQQIAKRLTRARGALDRTLDDLKAVTRRINKHRARIALLEAALAIPAAERQARAQRAVATRRAVPVHRKRAMRVSEEEP